MDTKYIVYGFNEHGFKIRVMDDQEKLRELGNWSRTELRLDTLEQGVMSTVVTMAHDYKIDFDLRPQRTIATIVRDDSILFEPPEFPWSKRIGPQPVRSACCNAPVDIPPKPWFPLCVRCNGKLTHGFFPYPGEHLPMHSMRCLLPICGSRCSQCEPPCKCIKSPDHKEKCDYVCDHREVADE